MWTSAHHHHITVFNALSACDSAFISVSLMHCCNSNFDALTSQFGHRNSPSWESVIQHSMGYKCELWPTSCPLWTWPFAFIWIFQLVQYSNAYCLQCTLFWMYNILNVLNVQCFECLECTVFWMSWMFSVLNVSTVSSFQSYRLFSTKFSFHEAHVSIKIVGSKPATNCGYYT